MVSKTTTLGEIAEVVMGQSPKGEDVNTDEEGFPLLNGPTEFKSRYPVPVQYTNEGKKFSEAGDILFCVRGSTTGRMNYSDKSYVIGRGIAAIRGKNGYPTPYIRAVIEKNLERLLVAATGSTFPNVGKELILNFEVETVSVDDSLAINDLIVSFEDKIELNRQTNQTLEQIAQAIFKSWFIDFEPTRAKIIIKQKLDSLFPGERAGVRAEELQQLAAQAIICGAVTLEQLATIELNSATIIADLLGLIHAKLNEQSSENIESTTHTANTAAVNNNGLPDSLVATAALFPDALVDSELGEIPEGWKIKKINDVVKRLKPKKRYKKNQVEPFGDVPVYEQGTDILLGYHNDEAGFSASSEAPLFIFGDHTCIIHLSCEDFDISQNVVPLSGSKYPTIWVYYAVQGKQVFQEYRRHWSEFVIKELVTPCVEISEAYAKLTTSLYKQKEQLVRENKVLAQIRDTLLPKLISGELAITDVDRQMEP